MTCTHDRRDFFFQQDKTILIRKYITNYKSNTAYKEVLFLAFVHKHSLKDHLFFCNK